MKLVRCGAGGAEQPGLTDDEDRLRDLSGQIRDIDGSAIGALGSKALAAIDPASLPLIEDDVRHGVPVGGSGRLKDRQIQGPVSTIV